MQMLRILAALSLATLALANGAAAVTAPPPDPREDATRKLHALLEEQWESWMQDAPTWASQLGDRRYNDRWPDLSDAARARRAAQDASVLARAKAIDASALSPTDRINLDLFERSLAESIEERGLKTHVLALDMRSGIQSANETAESLRFTTVKDFEDWIARMRGLASYMDQTIALLAEGVRTGMVQPKIVMSRVPDQIAKQVVDDPTKSPFWQAFEKMPDEIAATEQERLRLAARAAITEIVVPAYRKFQRFFLETYLPACRESIGCSALPNGKEIYAFRVRQMTTTNLTPEEIHAIGSKEVARIRGEMQRVIDQVGFKGSFAEFLQYLRTDPRFFAKTSDELFMRYQAISKRIDPEVVKVIGKLPRMPYGVKPIPDESAPDTTTAYYQEGAPDGSRAGAYYVNLYKPEARPSWEMMALSLHEAVPGHHLQISLAQELGELPNFRRYTGYTAFVEGWGLYSESLGEEMGLYDDPYSKFGQLTYEMWRAVRLVVDTGMHAFDWDRQRSIDYFKANAAKSELDIVNEIDRYIGWPGQALAYKIGELKIKELRRRAIADLRDRFDLRSFHDVVLGSGAIPLDVLERNVDAWIRTEKARPAAATD